MRKETEKALDNILDCLTGADGGVKFALFIMRLRELDQQAENGDKAANELIGIMIKFNKLVNILSMEDLPRKNEDTA